MRRKRYLMAVDSVISAIKMGSSCEASCCSLPNQWHSWQQPQPSQTGWNPTKHWVKSPNPLQNAREAVTGLFLSEICSWLQSCGMAEFVRSTVKSEAEWPCSHGWSLWHLRRVFLCSPSKHFKGFTSSVVYLTGDSPRLSASLENLFTFLNICQSVSPGTIQRS